MQTVYATGNGLRVSPKKAKLVVDQIKKLPPQDAIKMLDFVNKGSAPLLKKLILSAIANAKNNNGLDENTLKFKEILVGRGMVFKRYRAVSRGRAHHILKRTSNIKVVLEGEQTKAQEVHNQEISKVENVSTSRNTEVSNVQDEVKEAKEIKEEKIKVKKEKK